MNSLKNYCYEVIRLSRRQFNLQTPGHILPTFITMKTIDLVDSVTVLANQWLVDPLTSPTVKRLLTNIEGFCEELWLGKERQNLCHDIGTEKEWKQCTNCWFREINYKGPRRERHDLKVFDYSEGSRYSLDAWDFRGYEGRTDIIAKE